MRAGTSLTFYNADENVYDYLVALQRHQQQIKENPEAWLPWNYKKNLDEIAALSQKNSSDDQAKN